MLQSLAASQEAADIAGNAEEFLLLLLAAHRTVPMTYAKNAYPCMVVFGSYFQQRPGPENTLRLQHLY